MAWPKQDLWARWLLNRRHGGDPRQLRTVLDQLYPVRDKVLQHANLGEGETLLDVGCGDGLIGFGALEKVQTARVIFSDISQDLLDHAQSLARDMQLTGRCEFLNASADDLSALGDAGVDVVTTRSVLIYVSAKQKAFDEFYRVLKPNGRLSIFEPINRFGWPGPDHLFMGCDVTPVQALAQKVKDVFLCLQPPEVDPMTDFDERDLLAYAEKAGFRESHLELQAKVTQPAKDGAPKPEAVVDWESLLKTAGNPKIPSLEEAMQQVLTPEETESLVAHLRSLFEAGQVVSRSARAYVWAVK
jgi:ubiquinone/menaquinone biosynthesis C-methylase UbiE